MNLEPVHVPCNQLVKDGHAAATDGDLGPLERLLDAVPRPFDERLRLERYAAPSPERNFRAFRICCGR